MPRSSGLDRIGERLDEINDEIQYVDNEVDEERNDLDQKVEYGLQECIDGVHTAIISFCASDRI